MQYQEVMHDKIRFAVYVAVLRRNAKATEEQLDNAVEAVNGWKERYDEMEAYLRKVVHYWARDKAAKDYLRNQVGEEIYAKVLELVDEEEAEGDAS